MYIDMFKRVLIANRGEIALRIIRACNELGICSVAIYTESDRYALHVKRATEAYCIGSDAVGAYLNIHRIIDVAKLALILCSNCSNIINMIFFPIWEILLI